MNLYVFDYDGTFYRTKEELRKNILMMKRVMAEGHVFVIATGRSYESFIHEIENHNIEFDYLILSSGAQILSKDYKVIHQTTMDIQVFKTIEMNYIKNQFDILDQRYISLLHNQKNIDGIHSLLKVTYNVKKSQMNSILKASIQSFHDRDINIYLLPLQNYDLLEMVSSQTNKAKAIQKLVDYIDKPVQVIVAGDSENDLEMIETFDGYLMENHDKTLKISKKKIAKSIEYILNETLNLS